MRYVIQVEVESDRDEDNLAMFAEGVLAGHFNLVDGVRVLSDG